MVNLARLSAWADRPSDRWLQRRHGGVALEGARRLSLTTSGRSQAYALSLVLGVVVLMAIWLLTASPTNLLHSFR